MSESTDRLIVALAEMRGELADARKIASDQAGQIRRLRAAVQPFADLPTQAGARFTHCSVQRVLIERARASLQP